MCRDWKNGIFAVYRGTVHYRVSAGCEIFKVTDPLRPNRNSPNQLEEYCMFSISASRWSTSTHLQILPFNNLPYRKRFTVG